eukprot:259177_1
MSPSFSIISILLVAFATMERFAGVGAFSPINLHAARPRPKLSTASRPHIRPISLLQLPATKSGGRPISSEDQFAVEVLHEIEEEYDSDTEDSDNDDYDEIPITSTEFEPIPIPTLVLYSAPWCGPCRLSNPVVKEIVKEFVPAGKIDVVEVCTDDLPDVAERAGVVSIPTMQIYYLGELLDTIVGCVAKNVLASAVNKLLEDLGLDGEDEEDSDDI